MCAVLRSEIESHTPTGRSARTRRRDSIRPILWSASRNAISDAQAAASFLRGVSARSLLKEVVTLQPGDTVRAISFQPRDDAFYFYPGESAWFTPFVGGSSEFIQNDVRLLDARTCFFYLATGITPAMSEKVVGGGSQYACATLDADRNYLNGGKNRALSFNPKCLPFTFAPPFLNTHRVTLG
jgi:hypothetical protein